MLMQVCHLMRREVMDTLSFAGDTFVLEASLYKDSVSGLLVLPTKKLIPSAWIKKLVIITAVELHGTHKGIANLLPLQQMTNLTEVRILPAIKPGVAVSFTLKRLDSPIAAVVECIPKSAQIYLGCDWPLKAELKASLGGYIEYAFMNEESQATMESRMVSFTDRQGRLSGSSIDHSECSKLRGCVEGLDCVNSRCIR